MLSYGRIKRLTRRGKKTRTFYVRTYDSDTGRQVWTTTGCTSLKAAKAWVQSREIAQAEGRSQKRGKKKQQTFEEVYDEWFATKDGAVSKSHTVSLTTLGSFWNAYFGKLAISEIEAKDIRQYYRHRRKGTVPGKRTGRPIVATTLNHDLTSLKSLFNFALDEGYVEHSPARGVKRFSGEKKRRAYTLTSEDEDNLLKACSDKYSVVVSAKRNMGGTAGGKSSKKKSTFTQTETPPLYLRPLVFVALYCGFRKGTLLALRWRDVDLKHAKWRIPGEAMKRGEDYHAPIPRRVVKVLRDYRRELAKTEDGIQRVKSTASIFGLAMGTQLKPFQRAIRRAGLSGFTFHDLRRVYLNRLREAGVSLETAMALTDHRSVDTVLKYYRQVPEGELDAAVRDLEKLADRKTNKKTNKKKSKRSS